MHHQTVAAARERLDERLVVAVSDRLGCAVRLHHWQPAPRDGGPETPVFLVPLDAVERAERLGLTVVRDDERGRR